MIKIYRRYFKDTTVGNWVNDETISRVSTQKCEFRLVYAFGFCQSLANVFWLAQYQSPIVHLIFLWRSCRKTFYQFWAFSKQVVDSFFVSRIKYATNWKDDVATEGTVFWMWFSFRLSEYADTVWRRCFVLMKCRNAMARQCHYNEI